MGYAVFGEPPTTACQRQALPAKHVRSLPDFDGGFDVPLTSPPRILLKRRELQPICL
jgi:hypothetical protein